jgi:uncharacterized protein (DUF488 family)
MVVYTIGHSTRTLEELFAMLRAHGARTVIDVRRYPGSRRHPHLAKEPLSQALRDAGIGYVHEPDLGGRRSPRPESPNDGWRSPQFRGYADHLATPAFATALARVLAHPDPPVALMCAEAVPWRCHRQLISDVLALRGHDVRHILSVSRAEAHVPNEMARVTDDGSVVYPAPAAPTAQLELAIDDTERSR